jgi:hypothetical protein
VHLLVLLVVLQLQSTERKVSVLRQCVCMQHALLSSCTAMIAPHIVCIAWHGCTQDTNALVFRGLLPALGVSSSGSYDMISVAVPRRAKEAIGAIATLTKQNGADSGNTTVMTVNVEYNQLDPLLRGTISPSGDVDDETGMEERMVSPTRHLRTSISFPHVCIRIHS